MSKSKELAEVIVENGIVYRLGEYDLYYPDLSLEQKRLSDWQVLHEIDEACHKEVELAVERIKKKEGVTERLKAENPLKSVGRVNGIRVGVEEENILYLVKLGKY